jgi:Fibronectin type III domain
MTGLVRLACLTLPVLASVLAGCASMRGGVLDLSWTPPTANVDGTPATDIASYRIYYGTMPSPCHSGSLLTVAATTASPGQPVKTRLTGLKIGELYYIAVTAVSSKGKESGCSVVASGRARPAD